MILTSDCQVIFFKFKIIFFFTAIIVENLSKDKQRQKKHIIKHVIIIVQEQIFPLSR